jgi:hypothetical protein
MLTVPFRDILHGVHTRLGGNPANLQDEGAAAIAEYVNSAYKHAWRYYEWPDAVTVEERTTDSDGLIAWEQAGETVIETPFLLTKRDPRRAENPGVVGFRSHQEGIYCPYESTALWLTYRPRCPVFTAEEYSATATYLEDDTVYWPTTGECYVCIDDTTAGDAPSDATHWERLPFLDLLAEPVKAGAYAAMLREEGQHSPSLAMEAAMADLLLRELERIELQSGQFRLIRTSTY